MRVAYLCFPSAEAHASAHLTSTTRNIPMGPEPNFGIDKTQPFASLRRRCFNLVVDNNVAAGALSLSLSIAGHCFGALLLHWPLVLWFAAAAAAMLLCEPLAQIATCALSSSRRLQLCNTSDWEAKQWSAQAQPIACESSSSSLLPQIESTKAVVSASALDWPLQRARERR